MPAPKIRTWKRLPELHEKFALVESGQLTMQEVQEWCVSQGFDITRPALTIYKNSLNAATTQQMMQISRKVEDRVKKKLNMKAELEDIVSRLKIVLENTDIDYMKAKNPRDLSNLATTVATLAKVIDEMEKEGSIDEKSVIFKVIKRSDIKEEEAL